MTKDLLELSDSRACVAILVLMAVLVPKEI